MMMKFDGNEDKIKTANWVDKRTSSGLSTGPSMQHFGDGDQ